MKVDFKKLLLAGTAVVAVSSAATQAQAATLTLTGNSTWGTTAPVNAPTAGDDVVMSTHNLLINNTLNTAAGAITATTGDLTVTDSVAANIAQTIGSFASTGAGDFIILGNDANTANIAVTLTGDLTTGGALSVTQVETSSADTMALSIGDDLTVTGTTTLTAGANAGATSAITVTDDAAFTGAVTVTGGAGAGSTATLTIGGDATFTGGLNLVTDDKSILVLSGTAAQAVTGVISGAGDINVTGTGAVTFSGDSTFTGELLVNSDGDDQTVTFSGDFAGAIGLGDNSVADAVTANFNGTTQAISGGITGGAAETVDVNFSGGSTITLSGAASSGIDTLDITGSTTVTTNQNLGAAAITVASGSTLATTANTITGAVANSGTLQLGGGSVTGAVTGTGLLDVNANGAINGAITQGTADIAAFTLTQTTASGYTVGSTNFSGAGTLALAAGAQTVTGDFTNTTDGQGTISVADGAGTTAIVGDLGASTSHSLAALTVAGVTGQTVTTTGNLFVDTITFDDANTLQFLGTDDLTVSGAMTGGILSVGNGTTATPDVTFSGVLASLASLTVNDDAIARFDANATTTGAFSADAATVQIANGATLTAATQTDADVTQFNVVVNKVGGGAQTNGTYVLTGDAVNLANDTVHFVVKAGSAPLTTGASVLNNVFQGTAGATIAGATVTDNSFLYGFALVADTNNVDVTVTQENSIESTATSSANAVVGEVLLTELAASTDTEINLAQGNLAAAGTAEEVNNILESTLPTIDGGAVVGALNVSNRVAGVTSTRLAALRSDDASSGIAAGNMGQGLRGWVQGFGQTAEQDRRDGIDGYDADTYGVAIGADGETTNGGTIGLALSYGNTDVDSKVGFGGQTDVDSYQISLYGDAPLSDMMYVEGMVGYAWNDIESTRYNVGGTGNNANADFDANQFNAYAEVGRDYAQGGGLTLTPHALANWTYFDADDYTETGAGGLNLNVDNESMHIFELGVGVDAAWDIQNTNGSSLKPVLSAGARYDLVGDEVEATSTFTGGGGAFSTQGMEPGRTTLNLGAGVTYYTLDNWELSAEYDFEYKADYDAHSGQVRAAFHF